MSKKQIIIEGVDVSECGHYHYGKCEIYYDEWNNEIIRYNECQNNYNCYYKQLKRKEQEYEELRQYHNRYCEENAKKLEEWLEKYNQVSKDFYNGKYCNKENYSLLKAKEQECEELKEDRERWKSNFNGKVSAIEELLQQLDQLKTEIDKKELIFAGIETSNRLLIEKNNKLKQTLIEIKEIAKNMNKECFYDDFDCKDCDMKNGCTYQGKIKILQKISECEVKNEY